MNKVFLTAWFSLALLIGLIALSQADLVQASSNNDESDDSGGNNDSPISDALRDLATGIDESDAGTEAGREQAREDYYSGKETKTPCPREPGAWCFGYNTGYDSVMNDLESAHR